MLSRGLIFSQLTLQHRTLRLNRQRASIFTRTENHFQNTLTHSSKQNGAISQRQTNFITEYVNFVWGYGWQPRRNAAHGVKFPDMGDIKRTGSIEGRKTFSYFIGGLSYAGGVVVVKDVVTAFAHYLGPARDQIALANIEIDISKIDFGETFTFKWRGRPLFVRHRTPEEIASVQNVPPERTSLRKNNNHLLKDPEPDSARVKKPEWLIVLGICTHLGCVPLKYQGDYNGWFCPCHGSHYDASGRIRRGPAPKNLVVPPYVFLSDTRILVGVDEIPKGE